LVGDDEGLEDRLPVGLGEETLFVVEEGFGHLVECKKVLWHCAYATLGR
jgi:hypothetical protein